MQLCSSLSIFWHCFFGIGMKTDLFQSCGHCWVFQICYSYAIKRCLLLGRKSMINLDSILKSRDIPNKSLSSQRYGFSSSHVWMWELDYKETWAPKTLSVGEVLEKTLESPLDCNEIQPSILKEISPEYSLEGLMLKLKLNSLATRCEELTHLKRPCCWERFKAGGGDDRGWDGWMASPTQWTWVWESSGNWWWTGRPGVLQSMGSQRVGHNWVTELI